MFSTEARLYWKRVGGAGTRLSEVMLIIEPLVGLLGLIRAFDVKPCVRVPASGALCLGLSAELGPAAHIGFTLP